MEPASGKRSIRVAPKRLRWSWVAIAVVIVFAMLTQVSHRTAIPPLVESDYCYQLIAAQRFSDGLGMTSILPVAPGQPWEWRSDWAFLTQWPVGYPLLVCAVAWITGGTILGAAQWIAVACCALALVGWFTWIRRATGGGVCSTLGAILAATCSLSPESLINPRTDTLLAAALPFTLLLMDRWLADRQDADGVSTNGASCWLIGAGLLSGGLFWIRYASVFVPIAIGLFLLLQAWTNRGVRLRDVAIFAGSAALPMASLLVVNSFLASDSSLQSQLNLGAQVVIDPSPAIVAQAWWNYTDLGFYDYRAEVHWLLALGPLILIGGGLLMKPLRRRILSFAASPPAVLGACLLACFLAMLVGATMVFGDKYDYVSLERYYPPTRPLYILLFVGPILLSRKAARNVGSVASRGLQSARSPDNAQAIDREDSSSGVVGSALFTRSLRLLVGAVLLCGLSWTVRQEWHRSLTRWHDAHRPVNPSGSWAVALTPGQAELYEWLRAQDSPELIVFSNFHDYIAMETGIPASPVPSDPATADRWIARIAESRGVASTRVLFVLDPSNGWRDYYLPDPAQIMRRLGLARRAEVPAGVTAAVFDYSNH